MNRRTALQLLSVPVATSLARRATAAKSDRIVIAGAGIIGASIGYHLAKRTPLQKRFGVLVYEAGCGAYASRHTTPQCSDAAATARYRAARPASEQRWREGPPAATA